MSTSVVARVLHARWLVTCLLPREEMTMTPPTRQRGLKRGHLWRLHPGPLVVVNHSQPRILPQVVKYP